MNTPNLEVLTSFVDEALRTGAVQIVLSERLMIVPDTFVVEAQANGRTFPPSPRMVRDDGRSCLVYALPKEWHK